MDLTTQPTSCHLRGDLAEDSLPHTHTPLVLFAGSPHCHLKDLLMFLLDHIEVSCVRQDWEGGRVRWINSDALLSQGGRGRGGGGGGLMGEARESIIQI
jgi:hypothetical protein